MYIEETILIQQSLSGDVDALMSLLSLYSDYMIRIASRYFRNNKADIDDVIQDATIAICECISEYKDLGKEFRHWVGAVVSNSCKMYIRKNRRRRMREAIVGNELKEYYETKDLDSFLFEDVEKLLKNIPAEEKEIIRFHYYEGLTYEQISEKMNIPSATIRSKISRCFIELRRQFSVIGA
jgi:RNA polymerase sigma-70 factor (ECF subfamily)